MFLLNLTIVSQWKIIDIIATLLRNKFGGFWHVIRTAMLQRCGNGPISRIFPSISKMGQSVTIKQQYLLEFWYFGHILDTLSLYTGTVREIKADEVRERKNMAFCLPQNTEVLIF